MMPTAYHVGRHLAEGSLESPLTACPLCASQEQTRVLPLQEDPLVELRACARCFGVSVSRMPTTAALDDYYSSYYEHANGAAVTADDPRRIGRRIAGYCIPTRELSVLDFGGGDGSIGVVAAENTLEPGGAAAVTVVDYAQSREVVAPGPVRVEWVPALDQLGRERRFDLVIASAALEHLPAPVPTLVDLLGRVAPGGTFYARTPYIVPVIRLARRLRVPVDFTFPAHLHDLGQPFWDRLLEWLPLAEGTPRLTQIASRPSPLETSLRSHPVRTSVAALLKAPWRVFGSRYRLVGGWESVYRAAAF